ncbi:hypothetical protein PMAYCL1PPCAC_23141, partial [Pristionchus mayeri]
ASSPHSITHFNPSRVFSPSSPMAVSDPSPTPLLHLVAGGDSPLTLEVARTRLAEGDDPNMREDGDGLTPLHVAAHWDNLAMVQLLLLHGGDVWRKDDHGRTPMSMAQGETKKFLRRMAAKSEGERTSIFSRMAHLHLGSRIGKAFKGARKKVRRTLGAILPAQRRRADSECNNPGVITSTPRPSLDTASVATSNSQYVTADEGTIGAERTMAARGSLMPSARPSLNGTSILNLEWKRPATPPKTGEGVEIGWKKGLEKGEEKKIDDGKVMVTVRKKQKSPAEKKKDKDAERRPSSTESGAEEGSGESPPESMVKAPRGLKKRVAEMSEERLRSELRQVGVAAGPIGKGGVRKGYEKKLVEALVVEGDQSKMKRIIDGVAPPSTSSSKTPSKAGTRTPGGGMKTAVESTPQKEVQGVKYSRPLELAIYGKSWQEGSAQALDESIRAYFMNKGVTAFCYLLLDPRKLPAKISECTLQELIDAIFYVGKGTKARPHQHLIDARNAKDNPNARHSDKIARILEIWASGHGVVSLQLSFDICDEEAFTREASLMDAIGVRNLTNAKGGKYYGLVGSWQLLQKAQLGTLMLKRVWSYIRTDPSAIKPIRPEALPDTLFKPYGGGARKPAAPSGVVSKPTPPPPGVINRLRAGR